MTDKEVGRLWCDAIKKENYYRGSRTGTKDYDAYALAVRQQMLIRKLVEERAEVHCRMGGYQGGKHSEFINQALRDFGIDPEIFK